MCPDAHYFIVLLRLMPDNFTCQGESAATHWVNIHSVTTNIYYMQVTLSSLLYFHPKLNETLQILKLGQRKKYLNG
jgi:hypothetical protein